MADTSTVYLLGYAQPADDANIREGLLRLGGLQLLPQVWLIRFSQRPKHEIEFRAALSSAGVVFHPDAGLVVAEICDDCEFFGRAISATDNAIRAFRSGH